MFLPLVLIIVGALGILEATHVISAEYWSLVWPIVLIALGISLVMKRSRHCGCGKCGHCKDCKSCSVESK